MRSPRVFFESREVAERTQRRAGERSLQRTRERGFAVETWHGDTLHAHWSPAEEVAALASLPASARAEAARILTEHSAIAVSDLDARLDALSAHARSLGAQLQLGMRETDRWILCADEDDVRADHQRDVVLELKLTTARDGRSASIQRERAFSSADDFASATAALRGLVEEMASLALLRIDAVAAPSGPLTLVIPPGADAGVFFHEVCGHPLEGDVVARGGSYLARRPGQQVAESFVEVLDDPTAGTGVAYGMDDEGTPAAPVRLIAGGTVADPLLDLDTARRLQRAPNGHARRVSFRHPALPRMSHTLLAPHRGAFEEIVREVSHGLLVRSLTPRHVNLLTGDFSFFIVEAQRIEEGAVGPFVAPCLLRGNGLSALEGIDAVGADLATFRGLKGCGKLDHGPLPVSFGNPTVRIRGLSVDPWS